MLRRPAGRGERLPVASSSLPPGGGRQQSSDLVFRRQYWSSCLGFCLQCWENGIILCRELADQYESYYDYRNLSKMRVGFSK